MHSRYSYHDELDEYHKQKLWKMRKMLTDINSYKILRKLKLIFFYQNELEYDNFLEWVYNGSISISVFCTTIDYAFKLFSFLLTYINNWKSSIKHGTWDTVCDEY